MQSPTARLPALDVMRGLVMIIMTVDHASEAFNRGRIFTDATFLYTPGTPLPLAQFLTRWITHLCAPTFVLLAGTALALSTASRMRRGDAPLAIDRHLATRGVILIALDLVWMSPVFMGPGNLLLQVLFAIGASFLCMIPLRRLGDGALLAVGLGLAVSDELLVGAAAATGTMGSVPVALFASGGSFADGRFVVGYPFLPWLGIMCVGWVFGRKLMEWPAAERDRIATRTLAVWGVVLLGVFAVVRGVNGFGNMALYREDGSLAQWLHTSKYPPSLSYDGMELGLAALVLAGLFRVLARKPDFAAPVRTLGQVALFYYLIHAHVMTAVALATKTHHELGVASAWLGAAATLLALAPVCAWYRGYKGRNPGGWRQYV
jgi:uncharacterized membrane protein